MFPIGYKIGDFKIELEGLVSSVTTGDKHIEFKNLRGSTVNLHDIGSSLDNIKIFHNDKEIFYGDKSALDNFKLETKYKKLFEENLKVTNEGFQNKAAMINAYYDLNNNSNFTTYFGVDGCFTNIKFFGVSRIKPAIQGKPGLNYNTSDEILLFVGYKYFVSLGDKFEEAILHTDTLRYEVEKTTHNNGTKKYFFNPYKRGDFPGSTATVESKFSNHALEVDLTFNF
ncbi:MAG: P44/Msp2 family outer membrane protein [Wolbachia sp.]|nr:P44/Msp2 family outer membrane protein [Wolbachia sp.]MDD9336541.1 P44/Msp2 family outer membrane protein [Wolbachia sp.]